MNIPPVLCSKCKVKEVDYTTEWRMLLSWCPECWATDMRFRFVVEAGPGAARHGCAIVHADQIEETMDRLVKIFDPTIQPRVYPLDRRVTEDERIAYDATHPLSPTLKETPMETYTVIGLIEDASGELLIAGAVKGRRPVSQQRHGDPGGFTSYATYIEAVDTDDAIHQVEVDFLREEDEDEE